MKNAFSLIATLVFSMSVAQASTPRFVTKSEIRPFAKNFQCSNPKLQWQFDHLVSIWDENEKNNPGGKFITQASDVGGDGEWMYRGVTNNQFNESQILALIFNDTTQVSESRWFSNHMYEKAGILSGDQVVVAMRSQYRKLPFEKRWAPFESAYNYLIDQLTSLVNSGGFQDHVRIGHAYNGKPVSIQFLTPHLDYASAYGEMILHIHEVVKRGVDVERYNQKKWGYSVGSIYVRDRDEYMVPSHIPSWDIQRVVMRGGVGWLRGSYSPYYYDFVKETAPNNPCDVLGIRVEVSGNPVGMLLKCNSNDPEQCKSLWDGKLEYESHLKETLVDTRVDDQPVYYIPYQMFVGGNKDYLLQVSYRAAIGFLKGAQGAEAKKLREDVNFWKELTLKGYRTDLGALVAAKKDYPAVFAQIKSDIVADFSKAMADGKIKVTANDFADLFEVYTWTGSKQISELTKVLMPTIENASTRLVSFSALQAAAAKNSSLNPLLQEIKTKMAALKDLKPSDEISIYAADHKLNENDTALVSLVAKGLSKEAGFATTFFSVFTAADVKLKARLIEFAVIYSSEHVDQFPIADPFALWKESAPFLSELTGSTRDNILGACIDYQVSHSKLPTFELMKAVSQIGLPFDREIDALRAMWQLSKGEEEYLPKDAARTNKFRFISYGLRNSIYPSLMNLAKSSGLSDQAERIENINEAFENFYMEQLSPPLPFVAFTALNSIGKISKRGDLILLPDEDPVTFKIENRSYSVSKSNYLEALGESVSTYYFWVLYQRSLTLDAAKDPAKAADAAVAAELAKVKKTAAFLIDTYVNYFLSGFEDDLRDPLAAGFLQERFEFNKHENIVELIKFLNVEFVTDPVKKTFLSGLEERMLKRYPEMKKGYVKHADKKDPAAEKPTKEEKETDILFGNERPQVIQFLKDSRKH